MGVVGSKASWKDSGVVFLAALLTVHGAVGQSLRLGVGYRYLGPVMNGMFRRKEGVQGDMGRHWGGGRLQRTHESWVQPDVPSWHFQAPCCHTRLNSWCAVMM